MSKAAAMNAAVLKRLDLLRQKGATNKQIFMTLYLHKNNLQPQAYADKATELHQRRINKYLSSHPLLAAVTVNNYLATVPWLPNSVEKRPLQLYIRQKKKELLKKRRANRSGSKSSSPNSPNSPRYERNTRTVGASRSRRGHS